jgi:D-serine deaminase-like pyridoxal phosphate-dependent protein
MQTPALNRQDLLYAVSIVGNKLARVDQIQRTTDARILLVVDSVEAAKLIVEQTIELNSNFGCLIEIDCGELVRIVPNHACLTCAAYFDYTVVREGRIVDQWERTNGW